MLSDDDLSFLLEHVPKVPLTYQSVMKTSKTHGQMVVFFCSLLQEDPQIMHEKGADEHNKYIAKDMAKNMCLHFLQSVVYYQTCVEPTLQKVWDGLCGLVEDLKNPMPLSLLPQFSDRARWCMGQIADLRMAGKFSPLVDLFWDVDSTLCGMDECFAECDRVFDRKQKQVLLMDEQEAYVSENVCILF